MQLHKWACGRYKGYKPEEEVISNYGCGIKNENAVNVRKIGDPEIDLFYEGNSNHPSRYTEIT